MKQTRKRKINEIRQKLNILKLLILDGDLDLRV